jgi:hypothetical protein
MLQWLGGEITLGNMADRLKLQSLNRPNGADAQGTHEVAYLDDLVGNILFQFSVYALGESQTSLPVINPERPPALNEKAIVKNRSNHAPAYAKRSGTAWAFDRMIGKPDNYARERAAQRRRSHACERFAACRAVFSREELRPIVCGAGHIPGWVSTRAPERITPAMTGVDGAGQNPPAEDRGSAILNKPPLLSDLYALNVIDGGDETAEAFNEAQWGDHAWGFLVDGGHEKYLPFWYNRVYPALGELADAG